MKRKLGCFLAVVLFAFGFSINAATYTVTSITDTGSDTGTDGKLSWAITQSNSVPGNIVFNLVSGSTVTISGALPAITNSTTIDGTNSGSGGGNVTIQVTTPGTSAWRVFEINAPGKTISISDMTIQGGDISALADANSYGGGISLVSGTLNLTGLTVSGSKAKKGGGIYYASGTATITSSTISGNSATSMGGGIYKEHGTATITSSTISGNNVVGYGGGIFSDFDDTTISSSTISGNSATLMGGGIFNNMETVAVSSSTISGNTAATGTGGGIYNSMGTAYLLNTIVINNTASTGRDIYNDNNAYAYYSWYNSIAGNAVNVQLNAPNQTAAYDSKLGTLQLNSPGTTETMEALTGCTAIGNGTFVYNTDNTLAGYKFPADDGLYHNLTVYATTTGVEPAGKITTDQRGISISDPACIGAYFPAYIVTYDGNGNTGGSVPTDSNNYVQGAMVTVKGNTGSIVKTGYSFNNWNTAADGSGTSYAPAAIFLMGAANVTLYAQWIVQTLTITASAGANGSITPGATVDYGTDKTFTITPDIISPMCLLILYQSVHLQVTHSRISRRITRFPRLSQ